MKTTPCNDCPWRVDAPVEHWDPQHFTDIWQSCQDDGVALMLCHKSRPDEGLKLPCAGYVIVVGYDSIGVRIAAMKEQLNVEDFHTDEKLYPSFEAMLKANDVKPPKRNRWTRR